MNMITESDIKDRRIKLLEEEKKWSKSQKSGNGKREWKVKATS